jgi:CSLREA domain-containing protein
MFPDYRRWLVLMVSICLILGILPASQARAADPLVFSVNSTDDDVDFATNSVCSVGHITDGPCTLRAALSEAYWNLPSQDVVINLDSATYGLTIPPDLTNDINTGDLNIPNTTSTHKIIINTNDPKNRAVIDANGLDRVLRIGEGVNIRLENVVIRGGLLSLISETPEGAGILNWGKLELHNVIIEDNEARCGLANCDSIYIAGGGILNFGEVIMISSTVRDNTSQGGSAIFNTLHVTPYSGRFVILNSTIANNHASSGGTMINYGYMHLRNTTISNNTAGGSVGILNYNNLVVESSTFANAGPHASISNRKSGDIYFGAVTIKDSLLAALPGLNSYNCSSTTGTTWESSGYNIFSDASCPSTGTGDLINTDPKLGPLGNWGGLTMTRPLRAGSPAVNHRPDVCTTIPYSPILPPEVLRFDQRYFPRDDGMCDTGAFEGTADVLDVFMPLVLK